MLSSLRVLMVAMVVVLGASVIFAGPAFAKGKLHPTLAVTPNPAPENSVVQVSGCGYTVGAPTGIRIDTPTAVEFAGMPVDSAGCIAGSFAVYGAGTYTVQIYQDPNSRWVMEASSTLTVQ